MMITKPIIATDQETPLASPKIGDNKPWMVEITHETAIYKGFRMVFIDIAPVLSRVFSAYLLVRLLQNQLHHLTKGCIVKFAKRP
jgi:hypothetical protein